MNIYRKYLLFFCIIMMCIISCSCSNKPKYTSEDFGIYDTKTKTTIKLGDSRDTIEKYIGLGEKEETNQNIFSFTGDIYHYGESKELEIEYDFNGVALRFRLNNQASYNKKYRWFDSTDENDDKFNRFQLPSGISIKSKVRDFQEQYSEYIENKSDDEKFYNSELHLKIADDNFMTTNGEEAYRDEKDTYYKHLMEEDDDLRRKFSSLTDINAIIEAEMNFRKRYVYITIEYQDYSIIDAFNIGYGWSYGERYR